MATSHLQRASSSAIPLPTPLLAPVTSAVFDSSGRATPVEYNVRLTAEEEDAGKRLDQLVHERLPEFSRSRIQDWIKGGRVRVNGNAARAAHPVRPGEAIEVEPADPPPLHAVAEEIPLHVLYEDDEVVAIDK